MIIKEIILENFRCYYNKNIVKFNDGLNLFVGDNGDGKTTFFEALQWLFDTSKKNTDLNLISKKKISELAEDETSEVRVSMSFNHDGEKIIEKSFSFKKDSKNKITTDNFQFKGYEIVDSERQISNGGYLLDRCFDAAIRQYCLFKGEENLNVFDKAEAFKYLIGTFSNIRQFEPYYTGDDNNQGFTDYAQDQSNKAYIKSMKLDKENSKQEKELSSNIELLKSNLSIVREKLSTNRDNAESYSNKLNDLEKSKEASSVLKDINERLKSLYEKKSKFQASIDENYTIKLLDEMWILCGFSSIFEEYQVKVSTFSKEKRKIEDEDKRQKGKKEAQKEITTDLLKGIVPLSIYIPDEKTMKEMIEDEFCKICGRKAEKGSEPYIFMVDKLNTLLQSQQAKEDKEEIPVFVNNYVKELEQKSISLENYKLDLNEYSRRIKDDVDFNEARKSDLRKLLQEIELEEENKSKLLAQNDSLTEDQLKNAFENITNWFNCKSNAEKQIVTLENEELRITNELKEQQTEYDKLAKNSFANTYCKIHKAFFDIQNAFKYAKEKNTKDFLNELEEKSNKYLEKLNIDGYHGVIRIIETHDRSARIFLYNIDDTSVETPNQALKTTMYMSVLFAISELTTIRRENDYPLIFDAPTSSFTPKNESDFFKVISSINKQCIIFSKSFIADSGKLDTEKIEALNCSIYRMSKKKPFDNIDLSTIQTELSIIK